MVTSPARRILIADEDAAFRRSLSDFMLARRYLVVDTDDGLAASELVASQPVDVCVADIALRGRSGLDLAAFAKQSGSRARTVMVGSDISGRDRDAALRLGAVRVLTKPVPLLEMADAIDVASDCADGFHGWLHRLSLLDVLQMYHVLAHSLTLVIRGPIEGKVVLWEGEIVHAECDVAVGKAALVKLLQARRGSIESGPVEQLPVTISSPFDLVVLDSLRQLDEDRRRPSWRPSLRASLHLLPVVSDELSFAGLADPSPKQVLRQWFEGHAPGALAWLYDVGSKKSERIDLAAPMLTPGRAEAVIDTAIALAGGADGSWVRVELTVGDVGVAVLRRGSSLLGLAREGVGEEVLRRFRFEVTQLARWWVEEHADDVAD
jgi:CheY-like chemotaxis protein